MEDPSSEDPSSEDSSSFDAANALSTQRLRTICLLVSDTTADEPAVPANGAKPVLTGASERWQKYISRPLSEKSAKLVDFDHFLAGAPADEHTVLCWLVDYIHSSTVEYMTRLPPGKFPDGMQAALKWCVETQEVHDAISIKNQPMQSEPNLLQQVFWSLVAYKTFLKLYPFDKQQIRVMLLNTNIETCRAVQSMGDDDSRLEYKAMRYFTGWATDFVFCEKVRPLLLTVFPKLTVTNYIMPCVHYDLLKANATFWRQQEQEYLSQSAVGGSSYLKLFTV